MGALLGVLWWHAAILAPFALSLVLAFALHPVVDRLVRSRVPRPVAIAVCLALVGLVAAVLFVLLVPIVSQLAPMLRDRLPDMLVGLWRSVTPFLTHWGVVVPTSVDGFKDELVKLMQSHIAQWSGAVWTSVLVGGGSLINVLGLAVLVPMLAFYWLLDWHSLMVRFSHLLPPRWLPTARGLMLECDDLMGRYLRGQFMVMLILAVYYSLALTLFGFKLALPIGVFTGLAICIPYLGYGLGLMLAILAGLLQFTATADGVTFPLVAVSIIYGLGQLIESAFLTPRMVGERIGLHPLGVILALMLFGHWMGLWGVIIALPSAAFLMVLGRRLVLAYQCSAFYLAK